LSYVEQLEPPQNASQLEALRTHVLVRSALDTVSGRIGFGLLLIVLGIAFLGPVLAPYSATEVVGLPFQEPSGSHWLGTDFLGRDALSRLLYGGVTLVLLAALATFLAYLVGISIGMLAGYKRGVLDLGTVGAADLLLSFPPLVFVLVLLAALGPSLSTILVGIAAIHVPRVIRIVRSVTIEVSTQEFVEAALARGDSVPAILWYDILPNIWTPLLADIGIRFTGSVILFSTLSFLGLGQSPPAADWGLMISENRVGLTIQPWVVLVPALTIIALTISANLLADAISRSLGRSITSRGV
jgi:peptide/nickel transport system permease protein